MADGTNGTAVLAYSALRLEDARDQAALDLLPEPDEPSCAADLEGLPDPEDLSPDAA